jgi:hypothetical protein
MAGKKQDSGPRTFRAEGRLSGISDETQMAAVLEEITGISGLVFDRRADGYGEPYIFRQKKSEVGDRPRVVSYHPEGGFILTYRQNIAKEPLRAVGWASHGRANQFVGKNRGYGKQSSF